MQAFRVDPEFQNKIPPISEDEFKQLRENILEAGEVFEPLVIWNGIMIDGHNRWKVIQENPSIKYKVREIPFPDKWAAFEWMYKNQLGRRNLTDEQRAYTIGKMYQARKKSAGNSTSIRNADGTFQSNQSGQNVLIGQDAPIPTRREQRDGTAGDIGKDCGIDGKTVRRNEKFANGIDALRVVSPEAADKVLSGKANVSKTDIQRVSGMKSDEVKAAADAIVAGKRFDKPDNATEQSDSSRPAGSNEGYPSEPRKLKQIIKEAYAPMLDTSAPSTYNIDDLREEIEANGKIYVQQLRRTLENRRDLINDEHAKTAVKNAINHIVQAIIKEMNRA